MSKHDDHAAFVPIRFVDAFENDEVNRGQFTLGCYVAALCYRAKNTSGGVATVRLAALAELFETSVETIRRNLHALEPNWVECEVGTGQRAWQIRCTGLASPAQAPRDLHARSTSEGPQMWSSTSTETSTDELPPDDAKPPAESISVPSQPPQESPQNSSPLPDTRPDPTRPDRTTAVEEKRDTVLGPVTGEPASEAPLSRPERTWDEIAAFVRAHGGTGWGPVQEAVRGDAGYLSRRRDSMLEAGVLVDYGVADFGESLGRRFQLWHRDDPVRP